MGRFRGRDIQDRTEQYSVRAIRLFRYLRRNKDEAGWIIGRQYVRSATSIGANLIEADAAESRKDFVHKCMLALKEARESRYWLRLLLIGGIVSEKRLAPLIDETEQLVSILVSIVKKARTPVAVV